jgi:hypothetical protein
MLSDKNQKLWYVIIFSIAIAFGFWLYNPLPLYFLNDDLIHIPLSGQGILFQRNSLRPLGDLSLHLDYLLWQKNALGYHITNLLLHVINSGLVFFLSNKLFKKYRGSKNNLQSTAAAVLFFIYAFHSEGVFWIIGRSASLGGMFCIPAIIFYLKRDENIVYFILSLLFFTAGLFAYESIWIFPLIAVCISIIDIRRYERTPKTEIAFITIIGISFIVHLIFKRQLLGHFAREYEADAFMNFNAIRLAGNMFKLWIRCFVPPVANQIYFVFFAIVLFAVFVFIYFRLKKRINSSPVTYMVFIFLLISFLPYLSLGINTHTVEGERYEYLPSVFASLLLVQLIFMITANKNYQLILFTVLFTYHIIHLKISNRYYTTASSISKKTFEQINQLRSKKRLFIDSLPLEFNGALIFRSGFDEGVGWLKEPATADSIFIHTTKRNNSDWKKDFKIESLRLMNVSETDSILINDNNSAVNYKQKRLKYINFSTETDAWFIYTNNALQIKK